MSSYDSERDRPLEARPTAVYAERSVEPELVPEQPLRPNYSRHLLLFVLTCASTFYAYRAYSTQSPAEAATYAALVMLILTCHELGHYFQALRYRVPASLPF